jgi:hypothetical protein
MPSATLPPCMLRQCHACSRRSRHWHKTHAPQVARSSRVRIGIVAHSSGGLPHPVRDRRRHPHRRGARSGAPQGHLPLSGMRLARWSQFPSGPQTMPAEASVKVGGILRCDPSDLEMPSRNSAAPTRSCRAPEWPAQCCACGASGSPTEDPAALCAARSTQLPLRWCPRRSIWARACRPRSAP